MTANSGHIIPASVVSPKLIKPEDISMDDLRYMSKDSLAMWALTSGIKVDNNELDFDTHRYLLPIYMDNSKEIVWRKAAQLGATVYMLLRVLWWLEKNQGRKAGLYFPTKEGVENLSKDRLTPMIDSCPSISKICTEEDKLGLRRIGISSFYLYHLGGRASKDSIPLDFMAFDEVRLCNPKDIDQALERMAHSKFKYKVLMSTSGFPNVDIDARFQLGTQHCWISACGCSNGCNLATTFPNCVVYDDPKRPKEVYLRCPVCKYEIKDPQNGKYIPHNPGADYNSYAVSQLVSKYISPKEIWDFYNRTTNMSEFFNSKLGLPFIDEINRGVTRDQLNGCVDSTMSWYQNSGAKEHTVMGVDQGLDYLVAVLADINPDGTKKRIRHVEVIERSNPYYYENNEPVSPYNRLHAIMKDFNVGMAVIDGMPNFSEALQFAQQYPGKVFLANYADTTSVKDTVVWNDRARPKEAQRKAGPFLKFKYTCSINRFNAMSLALSEWSQGNIRIPNPEALKQMCRSEKNNMVEPEAVALRLFNHLACHVRQFKEVNEETGKGTWQWTHTSPHDHLAHAWLYCNIGLERYRRRAIFTFAGED